jgi:hypothetical protein
MEEAERVPSPTAYVFVVVRNANKRNNLGTLLRCVCAFGARALVVVGEKTFSTHGAHGSQHHVPVLHFYTFPEAVEALHALGCTVVGICSTQTERTHSTAVSAREFRGNTAFIVGEGPGGALGEEEAAICDEFTHVPFPERCSVVLQSMVGRDTKLSVALHHFTAWAGCRRAMMRREKYEVRVYDSERTRQGTLAESVGLLNAQLEEALRGAYARAHEDGEEVQKKDDDEEQEGLGGSWFTQEGEG